MNINYITPEITILSIIEESILCTSGQKPMELPDVTWKDETEW